ncbi:uncharacterized protein LY79DRAFT_368897 [Colletotrichum navitas]|uniref:Uncharacterized protein n=1 Tax=Colletotrichum navitas TaxID=681940 RepID=A0AAD8PQV5_9PEZI|nr:uncharacterized protein LY79DRAFT_368897 [Colletotrichum navitas]KAK1574293.1 hypothetical protein LY79DRAFT_368897 [Colletotrichum navitas]
MLDAVSKSVRPHRARTTDLQRQLPESGIHDTIPGSPVPRQPETIAADTPAPFRSVARARPVNAVPAQHDPWHSLPDLRHRRLPRRQRCWVPYLPELQLPIRRRVPPPSPAAIAYPDRPTVCRAQQPLGNPTNRRRERVDIVLVPRVRGAVQAGRELR